MAEIVGLTASIIAIGSAADMTWKMAGKVHHLAKDLVAAGEDIKKFAIEIDDFSSLITCAHYSLHGFLEKPRAQAKFLEYFEKTKQFKRIVDANKRLMDGIKDILPRLKTLESPVPLIEKLKWVWRRSHVEALSRKMESVKLSLQIVVNIVTLEATLSLKSTPETDRIIKRLNREIGRQEEKIAVLTTKLREAQSREPEMDHRAFIDLQAGLKRVLRKTRIMIDEGRVPDIDQSPGSSSVSRRHGSSRNHISAALIPQPLRVNSHQRELRRARSPSKPRPLEVTIRRQSSHSSSDEFVSHEQSPTSSFSTISVVESAHPGADTRDSHPKETNTVTIVEENNPSPTFISSSSREGNYIGVHPTNNSLKLSSSLAAAPETVPGYVFSPTGWERIRPLVDRALSQNLISTGKLKQLGLEYEPHREASERVVIVLGNGFKTLSLGHAALEWSENPGAFLETIAFRVHCLVYDRCEKNGIVLGEPFWGKRKHYLKSDA